MSLKPTYELSVEADIDLEDILEYSYTEFGFDQAENYLTELLEAFYQLSVNPELGRNRDEIKVDLRSFPINQHVVFYRILKENHIRIVRVLHGSRDMPKHLR